MHMIFTILNFLSIGTVVKNSTGKIQEYKKLWRCSKCKHQFIIEAQVEQDYAREKPVVCQNPIACPGKNFTMMSNGRFIS